MLLASNFSTDFGWYADLQALKKPALKLLKYTSYCPIKNNLDSLTSEKKHFETGMNYICFRLVLRIF